MNARFMQAHRRMNARFIFDARAEFLAELAFYHRAEPGLGRRFAFAVHAAISRAVRYPSSGYEIDHGIRRVLVAGFPHAVVYATRDRELIVFAIAHTRREPNYWRKRISDERSE